LSERTLKNTNETNISGAYLRGVLSIYLRSRQFRN